MGVNDELAIADHIVYVTLPLLNDKQLFINAVKHLGNAINKAIIDYMMSKGVMISDEGVIINEFLKKPEARDYAEMIISINKFNNNQIKSSIRLKKNNNYIIISPNYETTSLSINQLKDYIIKAKKLISELNDKQSNK